MGNSVAAPKRMFYLESFVSAGEIYCIAFTFLSSSPSFLPREKT